MNVPVNGNVHRIKIMWSYHAIDRVKERFAGLPDIQIPNRTIQNIGRRVEVGEEYHVRRDQVIYVCKRATKNLVVIMTVLCA
jgi:hypothetical protein